MRRRLLFLAAFSSALVLLVVAIALGPLVRPRATEKLEQEMREQILSVVAVVADHPTQDEAAAFLARVDTSPRNRLGLASSAGDIAVGRDAQRVGRWVHGADGNRLTRFPVAPRDSPRMQYPRFFTDPNGDRVASQGVKDGQVFWVIEGTIPAEVIDEQVRRQWLIVIALGAVAMTVSMAGAALISRRLTRPLVRAIAAAESLGAGDLTVTAPTSGPREVAELGNSLNQLAGRIDRLLASERERAATMSHHLRTPLTALRLETEQFAAHRDTRADERKRLQTAIADLERSLDDVIRQSLSAREEGLTDHADIGAVLRSHLDYWSAAAGAQQRTITAEIAPGTFRAPLSDTDLGIALDAILSNSFRHTPPGTALRVELRVTGRELTIRFSDSGLENHATDRATGEGSTGMGLSIAGEILRAAGGSLSTSRSTVGGFVVLLTLDLLPGIA